MTSAIRTNCVHPYLASVSGSLPQLSLRGRPVESHRSTRLDRRTERFTTLDDRFGGSNRGARRLVRHFEARSIEPLTSLSPPSLSREPPRLRPPPTREDRGLRTTRDAFHRARTLRRSPVDFHPRSRDLERRFRRLSKPLDDVLTPPWVSSGPRPFRDRVRRAGILSVEAFAPA